MNIQTHAEICSVLCEFFGKTKPAEETIFTIRQPIRNSDAILDFRFLNHLGIEADYYVGSGKGHARIAHLAMKSVWFAGFDECDLLILGQNTNGIPMTVTIKKDYSMEL
ncbi:MAG: hypothetical protein HZC01_01595 [Candidatus Kerfeldbacteria bacterium]|nr:hypothetical protein [Candidatus Kerfeldbacteria bacterium]